MCFGRAHVVPSLSSKQGSLGSHLLLMLVLQARAQLQETIKAQDAGKTNAWVTLQPPVTVVLKAGEHSCRMTHANREFQVARERPFALMSKGRACKSASFSRVPLISLPVSFPHNTQTHTLSHTLDSERERVRERERERERENGKEK